MSRKSTPSGGGGSSSRSGSSAQGPAVGIDLGTTYSCVGVFRREKVEIIANDQGNRVTPSYVAFTESERFVGDPAKNQAAMNPLNTVYDAKRLIGRRWDDPIVQGDIKLWPFSVQRKDQRPVIVVEYKGEKKTFSPEEISSMVLMKMRETAESYLGAKAPACEHAFCSACIQEWISRQPTCPVDRQTISQLRPVPRILRNLLSRLSIACENSMYGCQAVLKLDSLQSHLSECEHNPKKPVPCEQGCGLIIPMDELKEHNCVRELRALIASQEQKMVENNQEIADLRFQINEQKREIYLLKELMRAVRVSNPMLRAITDERDEVVRWANSLARARVTRWGGMISTPDEVLQDMIKHSLNDSGCPAHIVDGLMEKCHERSWPPGLSSLETRQHNRRQYESYICKRIPGKQAVVVLQCDNPHINDDMMAEPGLVMIFAHGIE